MNFLRFKDDNNFAIHHGSGKNELELPPLFKLKQLLYAGVDGSICRVVLEALAPGDIPAKAIAGVGVKILPANAELVNEVKRIGFIRDRES